MVKLRWREEGSLVRIAGGSGAALGMVIDNRVGLHSLVLFYILPFPLYMALSIHVSNMLSWMCSVPSSFLLSLSPEQARVARQVQTSVQNIISHSYHILHELQFMPCFYCTQ